MAALGILYEQLFHYLKAEIFLKLIFDFLSKNSDFNLPGIFPNFGQGVELREHYPFDCLYDRFAAGILENNRIECIPGSNQ